MDDNRCYIGLLNTISMFHVKSSVAFFVSNIEGNIGLEMQLLLTYRNSVEQIVSYKYFIDSAT